MDGWAEAVAVLSIFDEPWNNSTTSRMRSVAFQTPIKYILASCQAKVSVPSFFVCRVRFVLGEIKLIIVNRV